MDEKWIIFDAMGVIFTVGDDTNNLLVPFVQKINSSISKERINKLYIQASLGEISSNEFWRKIGACGEEKIKMIQKEYLDTCLTIDKDFIYVAKRLQTKYNLAILSNDVGEWSSYLRKKFGIDDVVKLSIISSDVKCRKPEIEIYKTALNLIGTKACNCVFIDDRDKNLIPAQNIGMNIIRFIRDDDNAKIKNAIIINTFKDLEKSLKLLWAK